MIDHIPADDLSARIDDDLSPARRDQVDAHLADCADCRAELESLRWAVGFSRALPPAPMPEALRLQLPEDAAGRREETPGRSRPAWYGLAAMAALLCLAFLASRLLPSARQTAAPDLESYDSLAALEADAASEAAPGDEVAERAIDIDDAARLASERSEPERDTEALLEPLATALTDERSETGELGVASALRVTTPGAEGTATAVAADVGGYRPPDAQIPGAEAARDAPAGLAVTASALTAARATAEVALALLQPSAGSDESGGAAPEGYAATVEAARQLQPEATVQAVGTALAELRRAPALEGPAPVETAAALSLAAAQTAETSSTQRASATGTRAAREEAATPASAAQAAAGPSEKAGTAPTDAPSEASGSQDGADEEGWPTPGGEPRPSDEARTAVEAARQAVAPPAESGAAAAPQAPRTLILPLAAISIGLLALGTLLLRQARRRQRRRRHLDL